MNKQDQNEPGRREGVGRINRESFAQSGEIPPVRDISYIDRQEGDMNNGELGGNFIRDNTDRRDDPQSRQ